MAFNSTNGLGGRVYQVKGTQLSVFELALGANTFGWTSDKADSFAVMDAYCEAGGNFIDTADVYSAWGEGLKGGESETVIGEWLRERKTRDQVVIATKVSQHPDFSGLAPANIKAACEASLKRLQTDYIDLYYAHFDDDKTPIADMAAAFDALVKEGKVRYVAISNFSPQRMREWFQVATEASLATPVAIQNQYNLLYRKDFEQSYQPICKEFGVAEFSYFSLASGFLTGKYRKAEDLAGKERSDFLSEYNRPESFALVDALVKVAAELASTPTAVSLAWLRAKGVAAPIASARNPQQLKDLVASASLTLPAEAIAVLDEKSQPFA